MLSQAKPSLLMMCLMMLILKKICWVLRSNKVEKLLCKSSGKSYITAHVEAGTTAPLRNG